jgi:hypothetical protein
MRPLPLVVTLVVLAAPASLGAQGLRGLGLYGGAVESRQLRPREEDSGARTGLLAGAFVDVALGEGLWSVLAEAGYFERGGSFGGAGDEGGEVQVDYLGMTVAPEWHVDVGFVGAFAYGGPTVEVSLRTRSSANLVAAYQNAAGQVLSVTAGGGVELRIPAEYGFRLEVRHVEGLSAAFTGDAGDFKHRSTEILVRVGRHGA